MPRGGMSNEATHCQNFSGVGSYSQLSLTKDSFLVAEIGEGSVTVKMPASMSALVILLGDSSPDVDTKKTVSVELDQNGVLWN